MRAFRLSLVVALVAVAGVAPAAAAPSADTLIRPGRAIGKARLGMSEGEVRRGLGRPFAVIRRRVGFGNRSAEYQYADGYLFVHLRGRAGALRVVRVVTLQRSERTREGIGVGVRERVLMRAYRGRLRCAPLPTETRRGITYVVGSRTCTLSAGAARTVFRVDGRVESTWDTTRWSRVSEWPRNARIVDVTVEAR
jgi:hypothetical protein